MTEEVAEEVERRLSTNSMLRHLYDVDYSDYRQSININAEKAVAERQRQEQIRRAYELLDLKGRMAVVPNDPKGPML